jgi:anti-sigma28 factor (negative regulator of flagellin synthesis)
VLPNIRIFQELSVVEAEHEVGREWKIAEIKKQIAAGTYDTPDRVDAAVDEILRRFEEPATDTNPQKPR